VLQLCWPFNTLVQAGNNYAFDFQAEDLVVDSLGWNVQNETLTLFTTSSFESAFPVIIVVSHLSARCMMMLSMHCLTSTRFPLHPVIAGHDSLVLFEELSLLSCPPCMRRCIDIGKCRRQCMQA
jgi:hypothetical protein